MSSVTLKNVTKIYDKKKVIDNLKYIRYNYKRKQPQNMTRRIDGEKVRNEK